MWLIVTVVMARRNTENHRIAFKSNSTRPVKKTFIGRIISRMVQLRALNGLSVELQQCVRAEQ